MAVIDLPLRGAPGANLLHRLISRIVHSGDARRTAKALNRLSDRELDDIGLCRGDISDVAAGDLIR